MIKGGVITGRVTNAVGEPVIGMWVVATRVRDSESRSVTGSPNVVSRMTDDRGVYRIFGLPPGAYVVVANGRSNIFLNFNSSRYDGEAPTYHPSATRDAASEVIVTSGSEAAGIDIRYRGESGHAVSGRVTGIDLATSHHSPMIYLANPSTGAYVASTFTDPNKSGGGFAFYGVVDGEYDLFAERDEAKGDGHRSQSRRVTVRGVDVTGVELKLSLTSSIAGKVALEPGPRRCDDQRAPAFEEIVLFARRDDAAKRGQSPSASSLNREAPADEKGEFLARFLDPARYRIHSSPLNDNWYIKSITAPAPPARGAGPPAGIDVSRNGILLKPGERAGGVTVTIAEGAARLRGRVTPDKDGARLSLMIVHLVPAETSSADEVLRYAEVAADRDGAFEFKNMAPGKYRLLAHATTDEEPSDRQRAPVAWDAVAWNANERAKLRREAEALKIEVELKPCQRVTEQVVKYSSN